MRRRNEISPDERRQAGEGRNQVAVGRDIGADVVDHVDTQAEKFASGVQRELGFGDAVAAVLVSEQRFAALALPLHRTAELARGIEHQAMLRVLPAFGAESAADVAGDHPNAMFRDAEYARQHAAHAMRILHVGIKRESALVRFEDADRAARLHELGMDARDHIAPLDAMGRCRESDIDRGTASDLPYVRDVVGIFLPDARRTGFECVVRFRHRRQRRVIDVDELGRVPGLVQGLGDDERHWIADIAYAAARQTGMRPREQRCTVGPLALELHLRWSEPVRREIIAGEDAEHARRRLGSHQVDPGEARMGVRRAQHVAVDLAWKVDVVDVAAAALASISTNAMTHGALPRLTQLWIVPRCTKTSPALRCTTSSSSSMSISPERTVA